MWRQVQIILDKRGRSVYWLSKQTGIPNNTLYQYKNNGVDPTFKVVCKIADALNVSTDSLREK